MDYSISKLQKKADCDALITVLTKELKGLQAKKMTSEVSEDNFEDSSDEARDELESATNDVVTYTNFLTGTLSPKLKTEYEDRLEGAEHRQYGLAKRVASHGVPALIQKQYDITKLEEQMGVTSTLINQVTARRDELPN